VSGSVQAPNGQIVFFQPFGFMDRVASLFSSSAYASLSGASEVSDGTLVELGRYNADASNFSLLATTKTAGGQYSFNLTNLGVQYSNDLIIRVTNSSLQMRAFVVSSTVDLDPVSETVVRLVTEQLIANPGATIDSFTVQELVDIAGAIDVLVIAKQLRASTNIEAAVTTVRGAAMANLGFVAFLTAAAGAGQTTEGPGDIGNHFPLAANSQWQYSGSESISGQPTVTYANTRTISGTKIFGATTALVSAETNSNPLTGEAGEEYLVKNTVGITNWGNNDPTDFLTAHVGPYLQLRFPLQQGSKFEPFNKQGIDLGLDLDRDGENDTLSLKAEVRVTGIETVTVPAGTFPNTIMVEATITTVVTLSRDRSVIRATEAQTIWLAAGTGPVRLRDITAFDGHTAITTIEELTSFVGGSGVDTATEVRKLTLDTNDLVFDPVSSKLYASRPGNPGSVAAIDPATGLILSSIPVGTGPSTTGNGPTSLALSDDGHYLYVALNSESAIQRIDLRTFTADIRLTLGADIVQPECALQVSDMKPLPGNGHALAVSKLTMSLPGIACGENFYEVAIYDDGVQRPTTVRVFSPPSFNGVPILIERLAFVTDATKLYGFNTSSSAEGFFEMTLTGTGVSVTNAAGLTAPVFQTLMEPGNGQIFMSAGYIVNPATLAITGRFAAFPTPDQYLVRPDSASGRVFFLPTTVLNPQAIPVLAYDMTSLQLIGTVNIPGSTAGQIIGATSLIRWGSNGLAFRTDNHEVFLINTSLIP
jgi:hypothetical protein